MSTIPEKHRKIKPVLEKEYLTPLEIAAKLGIDKATVYNALKRGQLESIRLGTRWFIHRSCLLPKMGAADVNKINT